jgi:hypothetical protein
MVAVPKVMEKEEEKHPGHDTANGIRCQDLLANKLSVVPISFGAGVEEGE